MRIRLILTLAGLAVGIAVPVLAQEKDTVGPQVRQQIEAVVKKLEDAYNRYDAAAIATLYTQDAVEMNSAFGVVSGRQAIGGKYAVQLATGPQISEQVVDVRAIGNDICAIAEWTLLAEKGYAATIYVGEGDDWKIRMDYINYIIDR